MSKAQQWAIDYTQRMTQFMEVWADLRQMREDWDNAGLSSIVTDEAIHAANPNNPSAVVDASILMTDITAAMTSVDAVWVWAQGQFHLTNLTKVKAR